MKRSERDTLKTISDEPSSRMARDIDDWLIQPDWTVDSLASWLQGDSVPFSDDGVEPFVWLQRALSLTKDPANLQAEFVRRVAMLLRSQPAVDSSKLERILYNLFMLCAWLRHPAAFGEPLKSILESDNEWFSLELRDALRIALMNNQSDQSLRPIWQAMLSGQGHGFLPGNKFDGFEGILLMPEPSDARNTIREIFDGLEGIAKALGSDERLQVEFRFLLDRAIETHAGLPGFNERFARELKTQHLKPWARMFVDSQSAGNEDQRKESLSSRPVSLEQNDAALAELLDEIRLIKPGHAHQSRYEDWIGKAILLCFSQALKNLESQRRDLEGQVRRDWIASNRAEKGFWEMVRTRYDATQVVFECKNYKRLAADDFHQIAYYMNKQMGRFGILIFRGDVLDHYYGHIRKIAGDHDGIVLLLTDADIRMCASERSFNPTIEESHIQSIYDRTLRHIS